MLVEVANGEVAELRRSYRQLVADMAELTARVDGWEAWRDEFRDTLTRVERLAMDNYREAGETKERVSQGILSMGAILSQLGNTVRELERTVREKP